MSTKREIALVSGGVDSILVTAKHHDAQPLFIDYGQREYESESAAVTRLWPNALRMQVPTIVPRGTYFPARNLLLATCAVACADADIVLLGGMADDYCADKTPEAFDAMATILSVQAGRTVDVISPFWKTTKAQAIADYIDDGNDEERLMFAFSCYSPKSGRSCGDCPACFRKACAFAANNLPAQQISERMFDNYFARLHTFPAARQWSIIHAYRQQGGTIVAVDIDGILTTDTQGHDYAFRTPNADAIAELNGMTAKRILWSARRECDRETTVLWLARNEVRYEALILDKLPVDLFYEDLSLRELKPC